MIHKCRHKTYYYYYKQLLDEVFVIFGIIKVEVGVNSRDQDRADNTQRDRDLMII